jgi:hypothetical protein
VIFRFTDIVGITDHHCLVIKKLKLKEIYICIEFEGTNNFDPRVLEYPSFSVIRDSTKG